MTVWFTLTLLCLACCCHGIMSCPTLCQCYPRRAEVVCNEVPLTQFPSEGLPENTTLLTIQYTNITSINEEDLKAMPLLEGLHLYSNNLKNLSSDLLRGVPRLNTLDLTGNKLAYLPPNVFSHAPLQTLVLKNNLFETVHGEWFSHSSNLTFLDISGNRLTAVPSALLQKVPRLENLDLARNRVEKISLNSLDGLAKLERLNLQNNKLSSLDASIFNNNRNLTYLFVSGNQLEKLPATIFQGLTKLRAVSLEDNRLTHIPSGLLDQLPTLHDEGLDLCLNPWLCDGEVEYLWRWLQENKAKAFTPENIVCAKPLSLMGRSVLALKESELTS